MIDEKTKVRNIDDTIEIVQYKKGWVVRKKFLWWHLYAGYDFGGMYGWGFQKEYFGSYKSAVNVSLNIGLC